MKIFAVSNCPKTHFSVKLGLYHKIRFCQSFFKHLQVQTFSVGQKSKKAEKICVPQTEVKAHPHKEVCISAVFVLHYISKPITTEQNADALGINRTYLCKIFKEQNNSTINRYITEIEAEEAKRLLKATDKPLADIAFYLGFSSQSHFQNTFHKLCGVTPKCFRKSDGKDIGE